MKAVIVSDDTVAGSVGGSAEREAHVHITTGRRLLVGDDVAQNAARYGLTVVDVDEADLAPISAAVIPEPDKTTEPVIEPEMSEVNKRAESDETVASMSDGSDAVTIADEAARENVTVEQEVAELATEVHNDEAHA